MIFICHFIIVGYVIVSDYLITGAEIKFMRRAVRYTFRIIKKI